ncbi:MAG: HEAT repeat domain-containing protein, partial [Planctomycetota bacterium]
RLHRETSLAPLLEALKDRRREVAAEAARALGELGKKQAVGPLTEAARKGSWDVWAAALEALGKIDPSTAAEPCRRAVKSRHYQVRMIALETAPKVSQELGVEVFAELIDDRDWRVRVTAIEAALEIRHRDVIGPLIGRLEREKGRLRWDAYLALRDLGGRDLGLEAPPWRGWWDVIRDRFEIPPRGKGADTKGFRGTTAAAFFNVPIVSDRIVFILDLSGSMRCEAPGSTEEKPVTMLDVAKKEMIRAIGSLDRRVRFGITGLGGDADHAFSLRAKKTLGGHIRLFAATPSVKVQVARFVHGLKAAGYSNDFDALAHAFADPDVDTIYLYGDGGTSRGTFVRIAEMLEQVDRLNRFRKIMIHTIEVPGTKPNTKDNRRFLKELAGRAKGICRLSGGSERVRE